MPKQGGIAAIAWVPHEVRTAQYAQRLNASLHKIHYLRYKRPLLAPIKYLPQCLKTWVVLRRQQPSIVYVMNPPVFAALSVFAYCRLSRAEFIMDTHSPALFGLKWAWTVPLQRALARRALVNIVDQARFKELFESWGARAIILERPPLKISKARLNGRDDPNKFDVTVVSTFDGDDPLDLVVDAARQLPDVRFFILGDTARAKKSLLKSASDNVVFPGYLLDDVYWNQLHTSDAVMVLTSQRYSLLGGAQEGMAMGKPLILSRQPVLTDYFTKGVVFVDHSVESMVAGVREVQEQANPLTQEIVELATEKQEKWETAFQELLALIGDRTGKAC